MIGPAAHQRDLASPFQWGPFSFGRLGLRENRAECFARELWLFGLMAVPAGSSLCRDAREVGGLHIGLFSEGCMRRANSPLSVRAWTEALAPWNTASHVQQGDRKSVV